MTLDLQKCWARCEKNHFVIVIKHNNLFYLQGSFSTVYLAKDVNSGKEFASKPKRELINYHLLII